MTAGEQVILERLERLELMLSKLVDPPVKSNVHEMQPFRKKSFALRCAEADAAELRSDMRKARKKVSA